MASDDLAAEEMRPGAVLRDAFVAIVARHHGDMLKLAYLICGDPALAEEAVQNAWQRAWQKLDQLRDDHALKPWLLKIAGNEARRAASRRPRLAFEMREELIGTVDEADGLIRRADLVAALRSLDPIDRQVVALRYLHGATSEEIGEQVGLSAAGARTRLHRTLARLRAELGDE